MKINFKYLSKAVNTAFLLSVILAGTSCTSLQEVTSVQPANWEDEIGQKAGIKNWDVKGRFGIQTADTGGAFDLLWAQSENDYTIRLIAPLGMGAMLIQGDAQGARIQSNGAAEQYVGNPERLIKKLLGAEVPILSLRRWMLGLPDEQLAVESLSWDGQGHLHRLRQAGWDIEMSRYRAVEHTFLPHAFVLQRDDRPELLIRLVIRQWSLDG